MIQCGQPVHVGGEGEDQEGVGRKDGCMNLKGLNIVLSTLAEGSIGEETIDVYPCGPGVARQWWARVYGEEVATQTATALQ